MIIQLCGATTEDIHTARQNLETLAHSWGHDMTEPPAETAATAVTARNDDKAIDPVAVTALVISIPSAALAVLDLADRIHKRRRATELLDHAHHLATQHITMRLIFHRHPVELADLSPDQLLDLLTDDDQTA